MGHFPLSADPVNGGGSNIGHYLALLTRFLVQNGFSSTKRRIKTKINNKIKNQGPKNKTQNKAKKKPPP